MQETKKPPEGGFFDLKLKITSSLQQQEQQLELQQQEQQLVLQQQEQQLELQQQEQQQEQLLLFYRKQPKLKLIEKRSATNFS
jgi:hypothetical protein